MHLLYGDTIQHAIQTSAEHDYRLRPVLWDESVLEVVEEIIRSDVCNSKSADTLSPETS